jgi:hypothetical protein
MRVKLHMVLNEALRHVDVWGFGGTADTEYSSFSYVTERGEGKMERGRGSKTAKSLSEHIYCN